MPRVRNVSDRGVQVVGVVRDLTGEPAAGRSVTVSLPIICMWRGQILVNRQGTKTGKDGRFEFWLPPTSELQPVDKKRNAPNYFITCEGVGSWEFAVPDGVATMEIGQKEKRG